MVKQSIGLHHILPTLPDRQEDKEEEVHVDLFIGYLIKLIESSPQICKSFYLRWWLLQPVSDQDEQKHQSPFAALEAVKS